VIGLLVPFLSADGMWLTEAVPPAYAKALHDGPDDEAKQRGMVAGR
jgi:hypothetical protein